MIDSTEDQAAGLRRLFRKAPPAVVALYVAGRQPAAVAIRTAYRIAGRAERVLVLDEAQGERALSQALDLPPGPDLLSVLGAKVHPLDLIQQVPGLVGRVPAGAAALALPLLDDERRDRLVGALGLLHRHAGYVLIHSCCEAAADPSPFIFAAPRRLVVAEVGRTGATESYRVIKRLAEAGAGSIHVAAAGARSRSDAQAFFDALENLVRRHVGIPLAWLGELERDDIARGLDSEVGASRSRDAEAAFLRRLVALGRSGRMTGPTGRSRLGAPGCR
ncbi:MAG: flagellar FleN [Rhodocyclaceae bacterium]|jgi:flagellar biosynthesis protein FlhG|nr:flagellar FleN [Rhodocyclaceae bacterium]MCL4759027.1 flagellar FleN [Rhodocyclaceae bacterium]